MKIAWLTDIHLNFLSLEERSTFYNDTAATQCDAVVISGDIAEAPSIGSIMKEMVEHISKPIYYVLGNHDYYFGQVDAVRDEMTILCQKEALLHWLPASGIQIMTKDTVLLGQDGWADGRLGDYQQSQVALNDSRLIADLYSQNIISKQKLLDKMQQLADIDARQLENDLQQAFNKKPKQIIVLTHIPPFKDVCLHEGKISDDNFLPFFASKATGDVLLKFAEEYPAVDFTVLCGHTHSDGIYRPTNNMLVKSGRAEYYKPIIQEVFDIG